MIIDPESVSLLGAALASPTRVQMCLTLLDGRAWTAGELARAAGVTRSTASEHLSTLLELQLIAIGASASRCSTRSSPAAACHPISN